LEIGVEHVEVSLETVQRAVPGGEASCDVDYSIDLMLLADLSKVRD
jgi:hypothetical protein